MNKSLIVLFLAVMLFTVTGCGKTSSAPSSAEDLLKKAEQAMNELESVHANIAYDESSVTSDPAKRTSKNVQVQADIEQNPLKISEEVVWKIPKQGAKNVQLFRQGDELAMQETVEAEKSEWQELTEKQRTELLGVWVPFVSPVMDFSLLKPFLHDAEIEKIDYGYALQFSLSPADYRQLMEVVSVNSPQPAKFVHTHGGFPVVEKLDVELTVNEKTMFVTGMKMSANVTSYFGRDYIRYKQKLDAKYSYFNDIDAISTSKDAEMFK
ncbi:hypothetical protein CSV63_02250 [Sporosarcina sp. P34]|uniref:DUF6612 family protein n=1 Tax=Sporosarcina sp. P34 TaxID=2048247 RepID=UPI000C16B698|nr:DUF6612 family protein [Sporosarcina sp. P34]PID16730.1 hypothetical protein CSV63_02250 [Sporosarcina sp. P34]